jgi:hypothetical protein
VEPLPFPDSLCHRCVHVRIVRSERSAYVLCREPTLPKYASQPIRACPAFTAK